VRAGRAANANYPNDAANSQSVALLGEGYRAFLRLDYRLLGRLYGPLFSVVCPRFCTVARGAATRETVSIEDRGRLRMMAGLDV
jgi:hypothetical protein